MMKEFLSRAKQMNVLLIKHIDKTNRHLTPTGCYTAILDGVEYHLPLIQGCIPDPEDIVKSITLTQNK